MLSADTISNTTNTTSSNTLVGWTPESTGRGTLDIILSCFITILICTWTAIHPRIHTPRKLARLHKLLQLVKTILAPEMVCLESLQEWVQARKMMRRSSTATEGGLKLVHAFYIGMFGIRYQTERGYRVLWPSQYTWLLNNDLVQWSDRDSWGLSEELIRDKSKADGLVKLATICQVTWFVLQCITRTAHSLSIAPLEAMTLAYVFIVLLTYLFWWFKPKDIATASFVDLPTMTPEQWEIFESLAMENTYDNDGPDTHFSKNIAWYLVGRDCKDDEVLVMGRSHPFGGIKSSENLSKRLESIVTEDSMIITQWDEALYFSKLWPLICLLGAAFGALHLMSWNSTFPTTFERWLWRSSALASVVTSILCMQFETMSFQWDGPLTIVRVASPILYLISRLLMMGEVFAALRAMPTSTYMTYEIWNYWIHFL